MKWIVGLKNEGKRILIQRGFSAFARELNIEEGTLCKFELLDCDSIKFIVSIQS